MSSSSYFFPCFMVDCCILNMQKDTNTSRILIGSTDLIGLEDVRTMEEPRTLYTLLFFLFFSLRRRRCRQLTMHVYDRTASIAMNMMQSNRCRWLNVYNAEVVRAEGMQYHRRWTYEVTYLYRSSGCIPSSTWLIVV